MLLEKMQKDVKALCDSYKSFSWFKRLFFPQDLGNALLKLNNEEPYDLLHIHQNFFSKTWFFQRWIYSSLRLFSASFATQILKDAYRETGNLDELDNKRWNMLNVDYYLKKDGESWDYYLFGIDSKLRFEPFTLKILQEAGLLTEANMNAIMDRKHNECGQECFMHDFNTLYLYEFDPMPLPLTSVSTPENTKRIHAPDPLVKKNTQALITAIVNQKRPKDIVNAFKILQEKDLLKGEHAQAIYDIVISNKNSYEAASSFRHLKACGLLESERATTIIQLLATRADSHFALALTILQKAGLFETSFAQVCFDAMVNPRCNPSHDDIDCDQNPYDCALSLAILQEKRLLQGAEAQANFDAVINHKLPSHLRNALKKLYQCNLLDGPYAQTNFDIIIKHEELRHISFLFDVLDDSKLLQGSNAQANFDALIPNHTNLYGIAHALIRLYRCGILAGTNAQMNFHNIMKHRVLLLDHEDSELWKQIPPQKMTQRYLDELITICQQSELSENEKRSQIVDSWLKTDPEVFAYADKKSSQYIYPFITSTLKSLHQRKENIALNAVFDVTNNEERGYCFYIIQNLIRRNSKEVLNDIAFLLQIPSVRALAAQGVTPSNKTNRLLKLALKLNNQEAAALLLEIPEVKELAEQNNYYNKKNTSKSKSSMSSSIDDSNLGFFHHDSQEESNNDGLNNTCTSSLS